MRDLNLEEDDIWLYLVAVLGKRPAVDGQGRVRLVCPFTSHPGLDSYLIPATGQWYCVAGCGRGDVAIYEWGRSRVAYLRQAHQSVLKIIEVENQKRLNADEAAQAAMYKAAEGLPDGPRRLYGMIARKPGRSRRDYQQGSHMDRRDFRNSLRELVRRRLISKESARTPRGRRRVCYFPLVANQPTTGPLSGERTIVSDRGKSDG